MLRLGEGESGERKEENFVMSSHTETGRVEQSKVNRITSLNDGTIPLVVLKKKLISFRRRKGSNNNNTNNVKARSPPEISNSRKKRERGKREEI